MKVVNRRPIGDEKNPSESTVHVFAFQCLIHIAIIVRFGI